MVEKSLSADLASRYAAILDFFSAMERDLPIDTWTIDGLHLWPLVRIPLAFELFALVECRPDNQITKYQGRLARGWQILSASVRHPYVRWCDRDHNATNQSQADVVFLVCSTTRFFQIGGRWYNPYCDSFIPHLRQQGLSTLVIETTSDTHYRIPRYRHSMLVQGRLFRRQIWTAIAETLRPTAEQVRRLPGFTHLAHAVTRHFPWSRGLQAQAVARRLRYVVTVSRLYTTLLQGCAARVSLNDGYYSLETMAFIWACKQLGIATIEVQHGVQGPLHFAYRAWLKIPAAGYELLPTVFWCWGPEEYQYLLSWCTAHLHAHRPFVGGNPTLHIAPEPDDALAFAPVFQRPASLAASADHDAGCDILFTLQAFFTLPAFLFEAIQSSPASWRWWFRVHPQYWQTRTKITQILKQRALDSRVNIEAASDLPLVFVLQHMTVHITESSSSVLEAEALGVPSVVISEAGKILYADLIATGFVRFAARASEVLQAIAELATLRQSHVDKVTKAQTTFKTGLRMLGELAKKNASLAGSRPVTLSREKHL